MNRWKEHLYIAGKPAYAKHKLIHKAIAKYGKDNFIVLFNADPEERLDFTLPAGIWQVVVDKNSAGLKTMYELEGRIKLENSTGMVLKLK